MPSTLSSAARKSLPFLCCTLAVTLLYVGGAWAQSTEQVLFNLGTPQADGGLILDSQGNLFGTAKGNPGKGTIFEDKLFPDGKRRHYVLYRFLGGNDGRNPNPGLILDSVGNLYGTTEAGGANNCPFSNLTTTCGTVFELSPNSNGGWTETQLYNFGGNTNNNTDGANPNGGLVADTAGNFYGTTAFGGNYHGTVYQLTPGSDGTWAESVLYRFSGGMDGAGPSGLTRDSQGTLYGVTRGGGATQAGTVFQLSPNPDGTWTYHLVYTFCSRANCSDGSGPNGIVLDSQRNLYGVTNNGGMVPCFDTASGCGTLFKLVRAKGDTWNFHLLHTFCKAGICPDGAFPISSPTIAPDGTLYGLTIVGGANTRGSLYKIVHTPTAWVLTALYSFCPTFPCSDGFDPEGTLTLDSAGNLYGTTPLGGTSNNGVVFQFTP